MAKGQSIGKIAFLPLSLLAPPDLAKSISYAALLSNNVLLLYLRVGPSKWQCLLMKQHPHA